MALSQRSISCMEMCLAIFIVIAHNVYHWVPNEVPILVILAIVSFRIREGHWGSRLYRRAGSWPRTLLLALVCVVLLVVKDSIAEPIGHYFWATPAKVSSVISESQHLTLALRNVVFVWLFAAFGEEIAYRGYLLRRALNAFGRTRWGAALALLIASVTFGLAHYYKGPAGILDSTGSGLILGGAYLYSRRLWASTIAHGAIDTIAILFSYLGW